MKFFIIPADDCSNSSLFLMLSMLLKCLFHRPPRRSNKGCLLQHNSTHPPSPNAHSTQPHTHIRAHIEPTLHDNLHTNTCKINTHIKKNHNSPQHQNTHHNITTHHNTTKLQHHNTTKPHHTKIPTTPTTPRQHEHHNNNNTATKPQQHHNLNSINNTTTTTPQQHQPQQQMAHGTSQAIITIINLELIMASARILIGWSVPCLSCCGNN